MQSWSVSGDSEESKVTLWDVPWWAELVSSAAGNFDALCGHFFCGQGPDWLWRVPVGRARYVDDEGERRLVNSVADYLYRGFGWVISLDGRHARISRSVPVSAEDAVALGATFEE